MNMTNTATPVRIEVLISAPIEKVWRAWVTPEAITNWNFASEDWCCPEARSDLRVGGAFSYRMEAKDKRFGFDFEGHFLRVQSPTSLHFELADGRTVKVELQLTKEGTLVQQEFEVDDDHSVDQQRQGWQSILDSFKRYVEAS